MTPDPLSQGNGLPTGAQSMLPSSESAAQGALAQIPQLEQEESQAVGAQSQIGQAEAADIQNTYNQLQLSQPPQRNPRLMDMAPLFIGLAAIGGRMTGIHAKVMLGATNGMVQGILQGNEKAYQDSMAQFEQAQKRMLDLAQLRQQYFETLYRAYGDTAMAKERAIKAARDLVNDGFKHDMDVIKAEAQSQALEQKLALGLQGLDLKALQLQISKMREQDQAQHWQNQDKQKEEKTQEKKVARDAEIDNTLRVLDRVITTAKEHPAQVGGISGPITRGYETAKTALGGATTGAHQFQSDVTQLKERLPKVIPMGSRLGSKWSQEELKKIVSGLELGTTSPILIEQMETLKTDLMAEKGMPMQEQQPSQQQSGQLSPDVMTKAHAIKDQMKSGKLTPEQAQAQLQQLGFDP